MLKERLDKIISSQTGISRSEARIAIKRGGVTVNKSIVKDFSLKCEVQDDKISIFGKEIVYQKFVYLIINKPEGIISAANDKSRQTVVDLVPQQFRHRDLFPIGRLDKDTTGLLIITDDGEFAHKVISPKNKIEKSYIVEIDGALTNDVVADFLKGVVLSDDSKCEPAIVETLNKEDNIVRVIINEGKYHQIKRMLGVHNLGVNRLHRERIGWLGLDADMLPSQCRELNEDDIMMILQKKQQ